MHLYDDDVAEPAPPVDGHALPRHQLKTIDEHLQAEANHIQGVVTSVLHETGRKIWEVYSGKGRTAEIAAAMGAQVETFSRETGWDFDIASHRLWFLQRLENECPDEVRADSYLRTLEPHAEFECP